jgi:acyl-CoA oxidase
MSVTGNFVIKQYRIMEDQMKQNNYDNLDFMHHLTAGLKAIYATMTYHGIDACRMACGGAGYSAHSLLPGLFSDYSPVPTYEGDTTVMAKQCLSHI